MSKMLLTSKVFLVSTLLIMAVGEKLKSDSEDVTIQPSNTSLQINDIKGGFVFADTDTPDCENHTCVRKCCESDKVLSLIEFGCVDPLPDEPSFNVVFKRKDGRSTESAKPVLLVAGFPNEINNCTMGPLPKHRKGQLLQDGTFYTAYEDAYRDHNHYCLVVVRTADEPSELKPFTCFTQWQETTRSLFRYYAHSICLTLSCIALIIVVLCHVLIPKLRDLQGKCLLSHVFSLLTGIIVLLMATLWNNFSHWQCVTIGIIMHTAFIATFMWLTIMCFDIWICVRMNVKGIPRPLGGGENKIFLSYCAVAWGLTGVIAVITCTLQFLPADALPEYIIRPHIGVNRCFIIEDDVNLLVYVFVVLGTLSLLNVLLVGKTAHCLYKAGVPLCCCRPRYNPDNGAPVFNGKHLAVFRQRFLIFITTILLWATEVLSFKIPPKEMWDLTDLLNTLQGVFILVIFLSEKKKRALVMAMIRKMGNRTRSVAQTLTLSDEAGKTGRAKRHAKENETGSLTLRDDDDMRDTEEIENMARELNQKPVHNIG